MIHTSHSLEDTRAAAGQLVSFLSKNPSFNIIGLSGDLGSGKTTFTKCVADLLGIEGHITSPTFVIQKKYPIARADFPFNTLIHIDAYRLENAGELAVLGFKREIEDPSNLFLIEWSEKVIEALPEATPLLRFTFISEHVRTIEFPDMMAG